MDAFSYRGDDLYVEEVPLAEIAARFGTPCYIYSRAAIETAWRAFEDALRPHPHLICYAVKANSNLAILNLLARLGSGFDIVSGGELERVLCAGGDPARIVFAGVGKRADEMRRAIEVGIHCFNVESVAELERLNEVAASMNTRAPIAIRVNPDIAADTHPYISTGQSAHKFGVAADEAVAAYRRAAALEHLEIRGIAYHIGSQITAMDPLLQALERLLPLADALASAGIGLQHLDLGGGLGVRYRDESPPSPADYGQAIVSRLCDRKYTLIIEPGRAVAGPAGVLLTRVEYLKRVGDRHFAVVDAAMNDLIRPALYDAWQEISPVEKRARTEAIYDIVGPVCETADFLGRARSLAIAPGDLLAVRTAGAYGFSMSSTYNSRPRAAEILVDGTIPFLARKREIIADLMAGESIAPLS
ncbi:MAG: diaminopimelate decarboxylase [Gammaproteobacteria bacterium]